MFEIGLTMAVLVAAAISVAAVLKKKTRLIGEDSVAVTVDRNGFIKRLLPPGRQILHPFERVEFTVETKTKLTSGRVPAIATADGILLKIDWSGTYTLHPELITEDRSQRLRNLPNAEAAIARQVEILIRKLAGTHAMQDLFQPTIRERLERQASYILTDHLQELGLALTSLNLQTIELPGEVTEAMNKARAIETLDGAIRHLDPTTREVVRSAYQLDEILHWDDYLPVPSRLTMKRLRAVTQS
jgi:regulator of protease activity HflC (stomatin/prohibitin superfamily)